MRPLSWRQRWGIAGLGVAVAIGSAAVATWPPGAAGAALVAAFGLYLLAHGVRIARLIVLFGESAVGVEEVALAHAVTAPAGLLPLKIGEFLRIWALGRASGGWTHGLRAVWIERTFDAVVLAIGAGVALVAFPEAREAAGTVLAVAAGFGLVTVAALSVLPEDVAMATSFLLRRRTSAGNLRALRALHRMRRELDGGAALVRGKLWTLGVLTIGVWGLEGAALRVLLPTLPSREVLAGLLCVLSDAFVPLGGSVAALELGLQAHRWAVLGGLSALAIAAAAWRAAPAPGRATR